jgi:hypothetical protein
VFLIVNAAFLVFGLMVGILPWILIPGLCWAVGLGIHGVIAMTANGDDWAEEKQGMQWWLEGQRRRHEVAMAKATSKGALASPKKGAPRQRIEAPAEPAPPRMRVVEETTGELAAKAEEEQEAALVEDRPAARKRR